MHNSMYLSCSQEFRGFGQGYLVFGFSDIFFTGQYDLLSIGMRVGKSDMIGHIEHVGLRWTCRTSLCSLRPTL